MLVISRAHFFSAVEQKPQKFYCVLSADGWWAKSSADLTPWNQQIICSATNLLSNKVKSKWGIKTASQLCLGIWANEIKATRPHVCSERAFLGHFSWEGLHFAWLSMVIIDIFHLIPFQKQRRRSPSSSSTPLIFFFVFFHFHPSIHPSIHRFTPSRPQPTNPPTATTRQ